MEGNIVVRQFLDRVCKQVRTRQMHPEIREELLGHIEDRAELLMLEGLPEEIAVQEAVKKWGIRGISAKTCIWLIGHSWIGSCSLCWLCF